MSGSKFHKGSHGGTPNKRLAWGCTVWLVLLMIVSKNMIAAEDQRFQELVQSNLDQARAVQTHVDNFLETQGSSEKDTGADDCQELLEDTVEQLSNIIDSSNQRQDDIQTWLTASLTNQYTCLDSIELDSDSDNDSLQSMTQNLTAAINNTLSTYMSTRLQNPPTRRKLLWDKFPGWLKAADRKLLEAPADDLSANAVVAQDGNGTHTTIEDALNAVAANREKNCRAVIRIRAGTYNEIIRIPTKVKNIMLVGDGKGRTIIAGHRNVVDGSTTFNTATVGT